MMLYSFHKLVQTEKHSIVLQDRFEIFVVVEVVLRADIGFVIAFTSLGSNVVHQFESIEEFQICHMRNE